MTHRPNVITHTQEYTVLPGVVYDIHLLFSVFSQRQTRAPLTQNPGDATAKVVGISRKELPKLGNAEAPPLRGRG